MAKSTSMLAASASRHRSSSRSRRGTEDESLTLDGPMAPTFILASTRVTVLVTILDCH